MSPEEFFNPFGQMGGIPFIPIFFSGMCNITTDNTLKGNGHPSMPLGLAQQGAALGQVLVWNGKSWVPGSAGAGVDRYKGSHASIVALAIAHPLGQQGEYAIIEKAGSEDTVAIWDEGAGAWVENASLPLQLDFVNTILGLASNDYLHYRVVGNTAYANWSHAFQRSVVDLDYRGNPDGSLSGRAVYIDSTNGARQLILPEIGNKQTTFTVIGGAGENPITIRTYQGFADRGLEIDEEIGAGNDGSSYEEFVLPVGKTYTLVADVSQNLWYAIHKSEPSIDTSNLGIYLNNQAAADNGVGQGEPYLFDNGDTYLLAIRK